MTTKEAQDLGTVVISFEADRIVSFRFSQPWPQARFRPGRHLMDENFNLAELPLHGSPPASGEKDRRVKIFRTVRASDSLQHAKPYWNGNCMGTCNKSMLGMCSEGQVGRFAVTSFGHKVSHGPLWILTEALLALASRKYSVDMAAFVDDMLSTTAPHKACKGLKGNCRTCLDAYHVAVE